MNVRTRKLLALVAEDVTAEILSVCRESPQTEQDLTERIGAARATIAGRVQLLEAHGLLSLRVERTGNAGRPRTLIESRAARDIDALERAAEAFALTLVERLAAEQREVIETRRRSDVRPAADAAAGPDAGRPG
jgi:predicted ArsR family transcriptional regulator